MVVKLMKLVKIMAPIRIMNSMAVVRELSIKISISTRGVNDLRANAKKKAPAAPTPAPSVAVNTPP